MSCERRLLESILSTPEIRYLGLRNDSDISGWLYIHYFNNGDGTWSMPNLQYSFDLSSWTTISQSDTNQKLVEVLSGQIIYFRGVNSSVFNKSSSCCIIIKIVQDDDIKKGVPVSATGKITSLLDGVGNDSTAVPSDCFRYLFGEYDLGVDNLYYNHIDCNLLNSLNVTDSSYRDIFGNYDITFSLPIDIKVVTSIVPAGCFRTAFNSVNATYIDASICTSIASNALSVSAGGLSAKATNTILLGKSLTNLETNWINSGTYHIILPYTDNDTPAFNLSNIVPTGASKSSVTVVAYTDNTDIALACVAKRGEYNTVQIYHLDGSDWQISQLDTPTIAQEGTRMTITPITNAEQYEIWTYKDVYGGSWTLRETTTAINYDVSSLNDYEVKVRAIANGYVSSDFSNVITISAS